VIKYAASNVANKSEEAKASSLSTREADVESNVLREDSLRNCFHARKSQRKY